MSLFDDELLYGNSPEIDEDDTRDDELQNNLENEQSISRIERETQINRNLIYSDKFIVAIQSLGENKECTRTMTEQLRKILEHRNGTLFEDLYFFDSNNNEYKSQTNYKGDTQKVEPTSKMWKMLENNPYIIAVHNHPKSSLPSLDDFHACQDRNYKYGLVVCHNGTIYQYKIIGKILDPNIMGAYSIYEKEEYESLRNAQSHEEIRFAHIEHLQDLIHHLYQAGVVFKEVLWNER